MHLDFGELLHLKRQERGTFSLPDQVGYGGGEMAHLRAKVKLTNTIDEALARRGLLDPTKIRTCEADAWIKTETVRCVLPLSVMEELGLQAFGHSVAEHGDGRLEVVNVTEPFTVRVLGRKLVETAMVLGHDIVFGQMALDKLNLWVDKASQRLVPNPFQPSRYLNRELMENSIRFFDMQTA